MKRANTMGVDHGGGIGSNILHKRRVTDMATEKVAPFVFDRAFVETINEILANATHIDTSSPTKEDDDGVDASFCCAADPAFVSDTQEPDVDHPAPVSETQEPDVDYPANVSDTQEPDVDYAAHVSDTQEPVPVPAYPSYRPSTTSMTSVDLDKAALQSTEAAEAVAREKARRSALRLHT